MSSLVEAFRNLPLAEGLSWQTALSVDWWLAYAKKAYDDDPYHVLVEFFLFVIVIWLIFRKSYDPKKTDKLTRQEEDELIKEWEPIPLLPPSDKQYDPDDACIVEGVANAHTDINGKVCINFASNNFLGMTTENEVKETCKAVVDKYGVGSCGPRGFYGSIDVHLKLEEDIAKFYCTPEAIVYSDGIACVSSVIPAFIKRGDLIICDDGVHYGAQQGIKLTKCGVLFFKHNDMADLERVLQDVAEKDVQQGHRRKLNRRFIVVEGLYQYYGDICPLPKIVELKNKYKYRMMLDDSLAVGVLGATGRGSPEYWNVPVEDVEILCGTLDGALATVGGFCIGMHQVVDHQRLSGAGYCFSASAPPYTAAAGSVALKILQKHPERIEKLRKKATYVRSLLKNLTNVTVQGDPISPVVHIRLAKSFGSRDRDEQFWKSVAKKMRAFNIIVDVPEYIPNQPLKIPAPSLRMAVMINHSDEDLVLLATKLKEVLQSSLPKSS